MNYEVSGTFLKDRLDSLEKITTKQEKEALLLDDEDDVRRILKCFTNLVPINDLEADAMLLKIREISIGDDIQFTKRCDSCDVVNELQVLVSEVLHLDKITKFKNKPMPVGLFTQIESIINNTIIDDMNLADYKKLEEALSNQNDEIITKLVEKSCWKCNSPISIYVEPKLVFSKATLSSIYKDYVSISMFSHNSTLDIDSLYPFEREIYVSLISDKLKEDETQ